MTAWPTTLLVLSTVAGIGLAANQRPGPVQPLPVRPEVYFAPTSQPVVEQMLTLARVTANDVVYDLGSGDGRIVVLAAQQFGARGVGVELDPKLVEISRQVARDAGVSDRVRFVEADFHQVDLSPATVVTLYLSPGANLRLEPKLKRELRPGARIVSHQFAIGDWLPDATLLAEDGTSLFLWTLRKQEGRGRDQGDGRRRAGARQR